MAIVYSGDSDYSRVVISRDNDLATVEMDGMVSSMVNVCRPERLYFPYMLIMDAALEAAIGPTAPVKALHLGGCAAALARSWAARRPGSKNAAVEYDARLIAAVRTHIPWDKRLKITMRHQDAIDAVRALRPGGWDVIVRDVFAAHETAVGATPAQLATVEAYRAMMSAVGSYGLVLANVAVDERHRDKRGVVYGRRDIASALKAAAHVVGVSERGRGRRANMVLAMSGRAIDGAAIDQLAAQRGIAARIYTRGELGRLCAGAPPVDERG